MLIALYRMFYRVHYPKLCFFTLLTCCRLPRIWNTEGRRSAILPVRAVTSLSRGFATCGLSAANGEVDPECGYGCLRGLGELRPTSHKLVVPTPIIISSTSPSFLTDSYRFRCAQRKIHSRLQQNFTNYRLCGRRSKGRSAQLARSGRSRNVDLSSMTFLLGLV